MPRKPSTAAKLTESPAPTKPKKTGRPPLDIDERQIELLASAFCTNEEIAAKLGCSADTLERRFAGAIKKGRDNAKASLRVIQWQHAKKNPTMAIWLGKQYLGQSDKADTTIGLSAADFTALAREAFSATDPGAESPDADRATPIDGEA